MPIGILEIFEAYVATVENDIAVEVLEHNRRSAVDASNVRRGNLLYILPDEGAQIATTVSGPDEFESREPCAKVI